MSDSQPPSQAPPSDDRDRERRRLERVLPELIKRLVESGYEKISEGPDSLRQRVNELKLPKEVVQLVLTQLEETKHGLYRVVARELRDFLDNTSFSEELERALKNFNLEIKTQIRFVPREDTIRNEPAKEASPPATTAASPSPPSSSPASNRSDLPEEQ